MLDPSHPIPSHVQGHINTTQSKVSGRLPSLCSLFETGLRQALTPTTLCLERQITTQLLVDHSRIAVAWPGLCDFQEPDMPDERTLDKFQAHLSVMARRDWMTEEAGCP
jgi:hypothetical protein